MSEPDRTPSQPPSRALATLTLIILFFIFFKKASSTSVALSKCFSLTRHVHVQLFIYFAQVAPDRRYCPSKIL